MSLVPLLIDVNIIGAVLRQRRTARAPSRHEARPSHVAAGHRAGRRAPRIQAHRAASST